MRRLVTVPFAMLRRVLGAMVAFAQNIGTAFVQIWANKGRSFLTTLGIIIAVTSIITVVSFVQGFGNQMTEMVRGYGTQYMMVRPYAPRGRHGSNRVRTRLDLADYRAVQAECSKLRRITPFVYTHDAELTYGLEKADEIPVRGVTEHYQTIRNFYVDVGRFFGPIDVANAQNVVVLGRTVLERLQADETIVGEHVFIDGERFLVLGLLQEKGGAFGDDQDETIMIPYTTAVNLYPERRTSMPFLAEAESEEQIPAAAAQIRRVLRRRHGLEPGDPDDFRIDRQDQTLEEFETIKNTASGILGGIVCISLLVGGIGIMNVMLVSVSERTREIGLRKSVGGRRRDIMLQFLTEAVVLCTLGGMVGVVLGYAISHVASLHPNMVDARVPIWSVALALGFSAGTGVVFGMIPAFKAAILHPIDALRHE